MFSKHFWDKIRTERILLLSGYLMSLSLGARKKEWIRISKQPTLIAGKILWIIPGVQHLQLVIA